VEFVVVNAVVAAAVLALVPYVAVVDQEHIPAHYYYCFYCCDSQY